MAITPQQIVKNVESDQGSHCFPFSKELFRCTTNVQMDLLNFYYKHAKELRGILIEHNTRMYLRVFPYKDFFFPNRRTDRTIYLVHWYHHPDSMH